MYRKTYFDSTTVEAEEALECEPIEQMIERMTASREPMADATIPLIYNPSNVHNPDWDVTTDHMELAQDNAEKRLNERRGFFKGRKEDAEKKEKERVEAGQQTQKKNGETES